MRHPFACMAMLLAAACAGAATRTEEFTEIAVLGSTSFVTQTWSRDIFDSSLACGYEVQPYPNADSPNVRISY